MQTFITLLISYLLATATFASPIFPARPIRKDLKDLGHSVGSIVEDATTEPEHSEAYSKPATSGWAAPSTWRGDKEWHATGKVPSPSGHMPEHKAPQWHATGFAAPSAHSPEHHVPKGTGVAHKMPMKPENASFPAPTAPHFTHGAKHHQLSTGSVPQATGFPHKKLQINSTAGIWPSGAALPSGASWPSGAAWPSGKATFTLSTSAVPLATGRKPDFRFNATSARVFATGTAVSTPKLFSTGTAFSVHVPSGTAPSIKTGANVTTPAVGLQTAPSSMILSTAGFPKISANATTAPQFLTASSPSVALATAPTSVAIANATLSSMAFPTASSSKVVLASAPTSLPSMNATSASIKLATASSPSIILSTAAVSSPSVNITAPALATGTTPVSKFIPLETMPASDFHAKISASSVVVKHPSAALPSLKAPASTGMAAHLKPHFARPSGTVSYSLIKAPISTGELPHSTEKASSAPIHSYMHIATAPAEVSMASQTPSSTISTTESTATPSAEATYSPAFQHSAETKEMVHKSPGAPCSPDEKLQCKGESMYGHCQYTDGHWRWYWADVKDGHYCQDGAVHKSSNGWSSSSWGSSGSSW